MITYLLRAHTIDIILELLITFNLLLFIFIDIKESKDKRKHEISNAIKIKIFFILLWILIFLIIILFYTTFIYTIGCFICSIISLILIFRNLKNLPSPLNQDEAYIFLMASLTYLVFFVDKTIVTRFLNWITPMSYYLTRSLLIIFLIVKIISFAFTVIINIILLIYEIIKILKIKNININLVPDNSKIIYNFIDYKFRGHYFEKIIYFLITPLIIFINIFCIGYIKIKKGFINLLKRTANKCIAFYEKRNRYIILAIYCSMIVAFITVNITIIINDYGIFNDKIKEIFNLISTVILIPLIYEIIKEILKHKIIEQTNPNSDQESNS